MFQPSEERPQGEAPAKVLDEPAKLLLRAAELIEERGLCKEDYADSSGALCMLGAMRVAQGRAPNCLPDPGISAAAARLRSALGMQAHKWQDHPLRSKAEVVAKLREVALS